jgi:hypothetical protein
MPLSLAGAGATTTTLLLVVGALAELDGGDDGAGVGHVLSGSTKTLSAHGTSPS